MALTKDEREAGYKSVPLPPLWAQPVLRRVGRGHLLLTMGEKGPLASYDDGTPIHIERSRNGVMVRERMTGPEAEAWAGRGWLVAIEGDAGSPQRYRARRPDDGRLPRLLSPEGRVVA